MSNLILSISGIRGIPGETLFPENIVQYATAFATYCEGGPIVVGYDGRPSGMAIMRLVGGALAFAGADVIELGMVPTPTVQLAVELHKARGGIAVTASHNPAIWNGLKFLDHTGVFLNAEQNAAFLSLVDTAASRPAPGTAVGTITPYGSALLDHRRLALSIPFVDIHAIWRRHFKVVVDAVNASGSVVVPAFLESLGCEVTRLSCDGSGDFPHMPEPLPQNLAALGEAVVQHGADLGIAVDPDADRLVLFTETGQPYGEEYTITTAVDAALAGIADAAGLNVVINLSTTRAVEDIAARYGAVVHRTPVGEINVVQKMRQTHAVIGGEGSGGVILPSVHAGRDSLVGIALVLSAFASFGGPVSAYRETLPGYTMKKYKYPLRDIDAGAALDAARAAFANERLDTSDGVRVDFEDGWVHIRTSNTEPILRIIAEGATDDIAERYAASAAHKALGADAVPER
jgi:phosphomannomutase